MTKTKTLILSTDEKDLLFNCLVNQQYALEIVGSEIADIERGRKEVSDSHLKQLNDLYNRLVKAGF